MSELQRSPLCYLASPYTRFPSGIEAAFIEASKIAAKLIVAGIRVYAPICHSHPIAIHGNIDPLDQRFWYEFDLAMMLACQVLIVAHMDGWEQSTGVAHEIEFFAARARPIYDLDPKTLTMARRPMTVARDRFDGATPQQLESDRADFLGNRPLEPVVTDDAGRNHSASLDPEKASP